MHILSRIKKIKLKKVLTPANIAIALALGLIIFLRFYKVPQFFSFNFDEEYQASLAWEQIKNFHPIWIGVSASNVGFYLGPGYTYLNAMLFAISRGDPIILGYFAALFGLATMASIYTVTADLFSRKAALIAAIVYGGSAFLGFFDRRFWNPGPIPFVSIWLVYTLIKGEKDARWYIGTAALFAIAFHVHLAVFLLTPLVIYAIVRNLKRIKIRTWLGMIVSFLVIYSPLIVFDFVHNFDNIRSPFRYFILGQGQFTTVTTGSIMAHGNALLNALGKIWFLLPPAALQEEHCLGAHCRISHGSFFLVILSLVIIGTLIYWWKKGVAYRYVASAILLYMVGFLFYPGHTAEYYLIGLYALVTIAAGVVFAQLKTNIVTVGLGIFLLVNTYVTISSPQEQYGLLTRKKLIKETMTIVGNAPYRLETYGKDPRKYHPYGGWRYLFKMYGGQAPVESFADEFFGWIFPDELGKGKPHMRVIITDDKVLDTNQRALATFQEGVYRSYVFSYK